MRTQINSIKELTQILQSHQIDLSKWGKDGAKTVADLWHEIQAGESEIQDSPLQRKVSVVQVIIRKDGKTLVETHQLLSDGQTRSRNNKPPSEKMKPGENYQEAAVRCLEEELGATADQITIKPTTHRQFQKTEKSPSYPGLMSNYVFDSVECAVQGLPDAAFETDEVHTNITDPVRTHYWDWIETD